MTDDETQALQGFCLIEASDAGSCYAGMAELIYRTAAAKDRRLTVPGCPNVIGSGYRPSRAGSWDSGGKTMWLGLLLGLLFGGTFGALTVALLAAGAASDR